jgi:medium-chain acyl-[acyl-carrier-protein] hydrolase
MSVDCPPTLADSFEERSSRWVYCPVPRPEAALRLLVFPCAGGAPATYGPWCERFSNSVEVLPVRLPGREMRFGEPPFSDLDSLLAALIEELTPFFDRPFVLVGHSMGAVVAFELTRALRRRGKAGPQALIVLAHRAPDAPLTRHPICLLPEQEFWRELRRLGGTPEEVLENADLLRLFTPIVRADLRICELYHYQPEPPLDIPIVAYSGQDDPSASTAEVVRWAEHTCGRFASKVFPGGHFFPTTRCAEVTSAVEREISCAVGWLKAAVSEEMDQQGGAASSLRDSNPMITQPARV